MDGIPRDEYAADTGNEEADKFLAVQKWLAWYNGSPVPGRRERRDGPVDAPRTWGALADKYLEHREGLSPLETNRTHRDMRTRWLDAEFGNTRLSAITVPRVQQFFDRIKDEDVATTSIAKAKNTMAAILNWAWKSKWFSEEKFMRQIDTPQAIAGVKSKQPGVPEKIDLFTPEEVARLLNHSRATGDPLYNMWVTLAHLALRCGEVIRLDQSNLYEREGRLWRVDVTHKGIIDRRTGEWVGTEGPKWQKARKTVRAFEPVPAAVERALIDQADRIDALRMAHPEWPTLYKGLLWLQDDGTPFAVTDIEYRWKVALRKAGVRHLPPHSMRKFCASVMIMQGVPLKRVAEWLGDKSLAMVEEIYIQIMPRIAGVPTEQDALANVFAGLNAAPVVDPRPSAEGPANHPDQPIRLTDNGRSVGHDVGRIR